MDTLQSILRAIADAISGVDGSSDDAPVPLQRQFVPKKSLRERDLTILDMLNR